MPYTPAILFDFVSTSPTNGKILTTITDDVPIIGGRNVYYEVIGPLAPLRSPDFNTPDGVVNTITPTAVMPDVTVPTDSLGAWLEGSYTIKFYIEAIAVPEVYEQVVCTFVLDIKKQGASNCTIQGKFEVDVDCHCARLHVEDATDYQDSTIISHLLEIVPPTLPGQTPPAVLSTPGLVYDLTFTHSNVTYTFNIVTVYENYYCEDEVTVREDLVATYSQKIVCSRNICKLLLCLKSKLDSFVALAGKKGGYDALPQELRDEWESLQIYLFLYTSFANCGDWQQADRYFDKLQALLNCDCGCDDQNGSTPIPVTPACGGGGGGVTSIVPSNPQIVITNPSPGVYTIGLDVNFINAALRGVAGVAPVEVNFDAPSNNWVVNLNAAFLASLNTLIANGLVDVVTATPGYINITTPSAGVRQVDFDPTPLLILMGYSAWVLFTNANANNAFGTIDFDNTPYPLRYSKNTTFFNKLKLDGTFKYNAYNPGTPICILLASQLSLPVGVRTGMTLPCFDDTGAMIGALRILGGGTNSNLIFVHNAKYVQNSNVFVVGEFNLD